MKIGFVGAGNMGSAIIASIYRTHKVCICETDKKKAALLKKKYKVEVCDLKCLIQKSDVIFLAVKPQAMKEVVQELAGFISKKTLVVSIAAGITTKFLEKILPEKMRVVRTMPNVPLQIGEGITAVSKGKNASTKDVKAVCRIFDGAGKTLVIDEKMMDAVTAVSGSGPAYVFYVIECMVGAAMSVGFSQKQAAVLVAQTVLGSIHQMAALEENPAELRKRVTSKGGTTEAAIKVFDKANIKKVFIDAMKAAKKRGRELAR